jgi:hypothetical protein
LERHRGGLNPNRPRMNEGGAKVVQRRCSEPQKAASLHHCTTCTTPFIRGCGWCGVAAPSFTVRTPRGMAVPASPVPTPARAADSQFRDHQLDAAPTGMAARLRPTRPRSVTAVSQESSVIAWPGRWPSISPGSMMPSKPLGSIPLGRVKAGRMEKITSWRSSPPLNTEPTKLRDHRRTGPDRLTLISLSN